MGRGSSGGGRSGRSARCCSLHKKSANSRETSLIGRIAEGIVWGIGIAIAQRAVDAVAGPRVIQHETVAAPAAVGPTTNSFGNSDACVFE